MYNKRFAVLLFFVFSMYYAAALPPEVTRLENGVVVTIKDGSTALVQTVRLSVITDKIIRVAASVPGQPATHKSLMIADTIPGVSKFEIQQSSDHVTLKTASLSANVSLTDGVVTFYDLAGNRLLSEVPRDKGSFIPAASSGDAFYQLRQVFITDPSDAFYGLGQHQNGVMNYKGRQVVLLQYNTDVAVPFVMSGRNYGILWDNYSITRAGDVRRPMPLSGLKLYSADGASGWLTARYYTNGEASVKMAESDIDYSFLKDMKNFPDSFRLANGKVGWEGSFESPYDGLHTFFIKYAGYVKVWIDGKLQADRWRQPWNAGAIELQVQLSKGKKYPVKIEWIPDGGESYLSVKWLSPVPQEQKDQFAFCSEAGDQIDYYFIAGRNADEVIGGYRTLTGRAPLMPKWALGFWQSRERYKTQDEIINTVQTFRSRKIPLDNIVLDWSYWPQEQWGSQEFEKSRFPDAGQMISDLHQKYNTRFMISVWPKFYKGIDAYNEFEKNGWLYMRNIEDGRKDWIANGYSSTFYDPFNPGARKGFWHLLNDKLYSKGVDAWWLDATEPDIHSNLDVATRKTIFSPSIGSSTRYFNAFSLQNAKGIYEGQRQTNSDDRVLILTRSAYAGQQRYATITWSGDISSRWHDMRDQISAGINFSLSGLPYWSMDIGGFSVERRFEKASGADLDEWREMNTRWYQFGAFTPVFRVHGQYPYREIYNIAPEGHPAYNSMLYYNKLRYRLLPYIYSLAGKAYHENYTMMRGLIMDFATDHSVRDIDDQYMFGPSLLVNPVYVYHAKSRKVYLPEGTGWYDLYTGKYYHGGRQIDAAAPYERMPLFVKEGSVLPFGPDLQYTSEKPADTVTLYVYTGKDASFTLYEDEGTNYNYEKGAWSVIPLDYNEQKKTLTIGERKGTFPGMLQSRSFRVVWISRSRAVPLNEAGKGKTITYNGKAIAIKM